MSALLNQHGTTELDLPLDPAPTTLDQAPCRIVYWNCNGLDVAKLRIAREWVSSEGRVGRPTIVCLGETWHRMDSLLASDPCVVAISHRRPRRHGQIGRPNEGLMVLASQDIRHHLAVTFTGVYHVSEGCQVLDLYLTFAYLPPTTLQNTELARMLPSLPRCTTYMGDVNCRFPTRIQDIANSVDNDQRRQVLLQFACVRGLQLVAPLGESARWDHCLSQHPGATTALTPSKGKSDHPILTCFLPIHRHWMTSPHPPPAPSRIMRFRLHRLLGTQGALLCEILRGRWKNESELLMLHHIQRAHAITNTNLIPAQTELDADMVQCVVNTTYDTFVSELQHLVRTVVGEYDPTTVRRHPDHAISSYMEEKSVSTALRSFKRTMRDQALRKRLVSSTGAPVGEEAHSYYQGIYKADPRFAHVDSPPLPSSTERIPWHECCLAFNATSVRDAVNSYSLDKSGGADGIHTALLRTLAHEKGFCRVLSLLFAWFLHLGTSPASWGFSITHLLPKPNAHPTVDKTRPISLTPILRRVYERQLLRYFHSGNHPWLRMHPAQGGFRPGYSTHSHALLADHAIRSHPLGRSVNVLLDLQGAFDRVPHSRLLQVLRDRGCPPAHLSILWKLMMEGTSSCLVVNGETLPPTKDIVRNRGVFQGSVLSPTLFNIFIDPLAHQANPPQGMPVLLLFCDDIRILTDNHAAAQEALDHCHAWACDNGMTFGINKCGVVAAAAPANLPPLMLGPEVLPRVVEYSYLGFPLRKGGIDWVKNGTTRLDMASKLLHGLAIPSNTWPEWIRLAVYKSFIRSKLAYGLDLAYAAAKAATSSLSSCRRKRLQPGPSLVASAEKAGIFLKSLETFHKESLVWILHTKHGLPVMESVTALGSWDAHVNECLARLCGHLRTLREGNPLRQLLPRTLQSAQARQRGSILPDIVSHPLDSAYSHVRNTTRTGTRPPTFKSFLLGERLQALLTKSGEMQHYLLPSCRIPSSGVDRILYFPNRKIRRDAIAWRMNHAFRGIKCPQCMGQFNRRHVLDCRLFHTHPAMSPTQRAECDHMSRFLAGKDHTTYGLLDHALNLRKFDAFAAMFSLLRPDPTIALAEQPDPP